jgi:hypothetical protein
MPILLLCWLTIKHADLSGGVLVLLWIRRPEWLFGLTTALDLFWCVQSAAKPALQVFRNLPPMEAAVLDKNLAGR